MKVIQLRKKEGGRGQIGQLALAAQTLERRLITDTLGAVYQCVCVSVCVSECI